MNKNLDQSDFEKVDMRVGTVQTVNDFPRAHNPSYQLHVDFGDEIGILKSSAQLTHRYSKEELLGKQIIAVVNFPKRQVANFISECLILGAVDGEDVVLLQPGNSVPDGLKIS